MATQADKFPFLYLRHGKLLLDAIGKAGGAYIAFKSPVSAKARHDVMRGSPIPIGGMWAWGPTLVSCESLGDTFDWSLAEHYGKGDVDSITVDAVAAFAADVEKWIRGVHVKQSILFFIGPGIVDELSAWGEHSAAQLPAIMIPFLEKYADDNAQALLVQHDYDSPEDGVFDQVSMSCILQHVPETDDADLTRRLGSLAQRFPL